MADSYINYIPHTSLTVSDSTTPDESSLPLGSKLALGFTITESQRNPIYVDLDNILDKDLLNVTESSPVPVFYLKLATYHMGPSGTIIQGTQGLQGIQGIQVAQGIQGPQGPQGLVSTEYPDYQGVPTQIKIWECIMRMGIYNQITYNSNGQYYPHTNFRFSGGITADGFITL